MTADEIARILDALGQRLGPTGDYVFALAVRQVYIDAIVTGVVLFLLVAALVPLARRLRAAIAEDDTSFASLGLAVAVILCGACVAFFGVSFAFGLSRVLNPEYAALRDILGAIR